MESVKAWDQPCIQVYNYAEIWRHWRGISWTGQRPPYSKWNVLGLNVCLLLQQSLTCTLGIDVYFSSDYRNYLWVGRHKNEYTWLRHGAKRYHCLFTFVLHIPYTSQLSAERHTHIDHPFGIHRSQVANCRECTTCLNDVGWNRSGVRNNQLIWRGL